jgi:hypothetical protein
MFKQLFSVAFLTSVVVFSGTSAKAEWYYTSIPENAKCSNSRLDYYINAYNKVAQAYDLTLNKINEAIAAEEPIGKIAEYETVAAKASQDMSELHTHISQELQRCVGSSYSPSKQGI